MKTKNKKIISLTLAAMMTMSLAGCSSNSERKMINTVSDDYGQMKTIMFANDDEYLKDELYGFIYEEDGQVVFEDVLNNTTIELFTGQYRNYDVYVLDTDEFYTFNKYVDEADHISYDNLKKVSRAVSAAEAFGNYFMDENATIYHPTKYIKK